MERNDQFRAVWGQRYWIIAFAVVVGGFAYLLSGRQPDTYEARATAQVISGRQIENQFVSSEELLALTNLFGEIARTSAVSDTADDNYTAAVDAAGSELTGSASDIDITARASSQLLDFTASAPDPADAAAYANAYADALATVILEDRNESRAARLADIEFQLGVITERIDTLDPASAERASLISQVDAFTTQLAQIRGQSVDAVRIVQPASAPSSPASPMPFRDGLLATIAAGLIATLAFYARASLSDRYTTGAEISRDLDLALLAEIPRMGLDEPLAVEAFRKLRTQLAFLLQKHRHPVVLVTSANPGSGKSQLSRGITRAFAEEGQRVILVDADLRRPVQHDIFDLPRSPGLGDLMADPSSSLSQLRSEHGSPHLVRSPSGSYLEVLPAGATISDPAASMSSPHMGNLVDQLKARYDLTLFDTAPVLPVVDALGLSRFVDAVVLVVDHRRDKRSDVRRAAQTLAAVDVPLVGFIHNSADVSKEGYGYYDGQDTTLPS
jgi:non-specific protein-tyrosine kinase